MNKKQTFPEGNLTKSFSGILGLPKRSGKLKDLTKFDAAFFGVHPKQANTMDPQLRLLLEVTYEAIVDAGIILGAVDNNKTYIYRQ